MAIEHYKEILSPLMTREREESGPVLTLSSIDGPNGSGKTSIFRSLLNLQQIVNRLNFKDHLPSPVFGMQEPPAVPYDIGRRDTFRSLAKSHQSLDGIFTNTELADPFVQAVIFLLGRRKLEEKIIYRPPLREENYDDNYLFRNSIFTSPQDLIINQEFEVNNQHRLAEVGEYMGIKDRGTASTVAYQGLADQGTNHNVISLVKKFYDTAFLIKEDLTIIVIPNSEENLIRNAVRDEKEPDAYSKFTDYKRYLRLREYGELFTNRLVYINNDPSGKRGDLTIPVVICSLLITAAQGFKRNKMSLPINQDFNVRLNLNACSFLTDEIVDMNLPYNFSSEVLKIRRNKKDSSGFVLVSGDIAITNYDDNRGIATVVIKPNLEDELSANKC